MMLETLIQEFIDKLWKLEDILTEDDLRCKLFDFLEEKKNILQGFENYDLHSEIRRYGDKRPNGYRPLKYRSDLVYINRNELSDTFKNGYILPSKGYGFNKYKGIIELKLRRSNGGKNSDFIDLIKKDFDRLTKIQNNTEGDNSFFYVIVFDKKENIEQQLTESIIEYSQIGFKLFYKYIPYSYISLNS